MVFFQSYNYKEEKGIADPTYPLFQARINLSAPGSPRSVPKAIRAFEGNSSDLKLEIRPKCQQAGPPLPQASLDAWAIKTPPHEACPATTRPVAEDKRRARPQRRAALSASPRQTEARARWSTAVKLGTVE